MAMTGMSYDEAVAHITTQDPTFAVTKAEVRGVAYTVFANVPPTVPALMAASRPAHADGALLYLAFEDERWTYDAFCDDVARFAAVLKRDFSVDKGMRVAIAMQNCPELLIAMMAISQLGGVVTFLNAWWTTEELDYALSDSQAHLVIADGKRAERLRPLISRHALTLIGVRDAENSLENRYSNLVSQVKLPEVTPPQIDTDDDFAIMYSSGTTGHPKGVVQTHRGAVNAVFTWLMQAAMLPLMDPPEDPTAEKPRPSAVIVTPLFHVTATHPTFLLSMPAGAQLTLMRKWDADEAVRLIQEHAVTRMLGVPTQSADLMQAADRLGASLPSLDYLGSGGAKRPAAQVAELQKAFPNVSVATGWGMTETNANGIGLVGDEYIARPGCAGRLYPPVQEILFLDDAGQPVPLGEVGEITVKSPCNMREYLNKPDATTEVLQDGWLRTGDLGMIDEEGFVTIVDRKKNIIIRGGENIACLDVEGALHRHPDIAEACAFAIPHERLGEVVGAGVQTKPGASTSAEELQRFLAAHIAHFKIPERIWFFTDPLPRGATDKLDRRGLQSHCLATLKEPPHV